MPTDFQEKIYSKLRQVPKGRVTTYAELAKAVESKAYRAVGTAMNRNPYSPEVSCHRVVNSNGGIGGFAHGVKKKIELLKKEGVNVSKGKILDFHTLIYRF